MPYTNVDIFRGEGANIFSKKVWEPLNFMKKWVKKSCIVNSKNIRTIKVPSSCHTDY
jgi:hypothetical protein